MQPGRPSLSGYLALAVPLALVASSTPCTALANPSAASFALPARQHHSLHRPGAAATALLALGTSLLLAPSPARAQAPAGGSGTGSNSSAVACGWASQCPQQQPCCSEYGYCSAGTACLGGCNPQGSYGQGYCAPMPVCSSANYTFADDSRFQKDHADWNGDATKYDWTLDKLDSSNPALVQNNALVLTLTENGGGTRVSTTRTVLYGTIQASIKTVGVPGVVTAFITMSGVKDEIDFEWTTNNTNEVFSNYFWEGDVDDYTHGGEHTARNNNQQFITYGIEWTPTQLDWLVNGKSVRTLQKSSVKNGRYPQTPSRVQFSVWPAGIPASPQGTIDWSGGLIDWSSPAYTAAKAFQAEVAWVSIDCYANSQLPFVSGANSTSSASSTAAAASSTSTKGSRLARRQGGFELESVEQLWKRQSGGGSVNSYLWGSNDTSGQIGVSGSDRATIINSPYSTGQNMLVKNGDTQGVKAGPTSGSGKSIFGDNAFGNWWQRQSTAAHVGLIIGACAAGLFLLVAMCMGWARCRGKRRKGASGDDDDDALLKPTPAGAAASRNARRAVSKNGGGGGDAIPLVGAGARTAGGNFSSPSRPVYGRGGPEPGSYATLHDNGSSVYKGSFRSPSPYDGSPRTATPPVPSLPAQYQQQSYGGQPQYPPSYGRAHPQQQQQQWSGRY
ncbi:hypothetical protein JCM9279_007504 [Rhodotorula babjevae]